MAPSSKVRSCLLAMERVINDAILVIHRQSGAEGALKIINKESRNSELEVKLHAYASQCENVQSSYRKEII